MSMLEKIIYIADFIEPFRDQAACLAEARKLAFTDIDRCMYMILVNIIEYLSVNDQPVESHTILSYNYFKAIL